LAPWREDTAAAAKTGQNAVLEHREGREVSETIGARGARCVVFGGGGFIGSAVSERLLRDGHSLKIFERPQVVPYRSFHASEKVEWVAGDMQSQQQVVKAIDGADVVIHLVSTTAPKSSNDDPVHDLQSNLIPTLQLLDAMVARKVGQIIFISSGGTVYGPPRYLPVTEDHPTEPQVSYGIVKLAIEKYLQMYSRLYNLRTTILRVANPYGERQRVEGGQGAANAFLLRALQGQPIEIWGDGSVTRDYLYVGDVADAFSRAIHYTGPECVFNIGSGTGTSLNQLIDRIEDLLGRRVERRYMPGRPIDVPVSVLGNALAARELGWTPQVPLDAGLETTASWIRNELGLAGQAPKRISPD
jgi:UDP-glucose 4-epimerase